MYRVFLGVTTTSKIAYKYGKMWAFHGDQAPSRQHEEGRQTDSL
jgi:hypothetical protein